MEIFNNTTKVVKDDLENRISHGSRISIAAASFSIYAYKELKKQLESCEELRFIFTSPTFVAEKTSKERREFYIPRLKREKSLYGTEFEVRLRNELKQKAVAKECAQWMRRKVRFKSNVTRDGMNNFLLVENEDETYCSKLLSPDRPSQFFLCFPQERFHLVRIRAWLLFQRKP